MAAHLAPGGHLLLEIGATQEEGVRQRIAVAGLEPGPTVHDDANLPRVVTARQRGE